MRRSFTLFSIVVHAIVISAALLAQVLAVGALPTPHQPILFESAQFMPIDIHAAETARRRRRPAPAIPFRLNAAPVVAPTGVIDETGRESDPAPAPMGDDPRRRERTAVRRSTGSATWRSCSCRRRRRLNRRAPMRLHSGMKTPVKIVDVPPIYPTIARSAHIQGVVILEAVLDAKGRVESVRVLRSMPTLDQAAVDAVQQWRFTPALLNGQPVPVVMTVTVNFTLQ